MRTIKQIAILALILITLFASGCADSGTQDTVTAIQTESFEEVVENVTMQEPEPIAEPEKTDKELREELLTRLQEDGYNVTAVEAYQRNYNGYSTQYLMFQVTSREDARYELVNMSVVGYEYFPDTMRYGAKSRGNSERYAGSPLSTTYYLSFLDLEAYMRGDYEYTRVPVKSF